MEIAIADMANDATCQSRCFGGFLRLHHRFCQPRDGHADIRGNATMARLECHRGPIGIMPRLPKPVARLRIRCCLKTGGAEIPRDGFDRFRLFHHAGG